MAAIGRAERIALEGLDDVIDGAVEPLVWLDTTMVMSWRMQIVDLGKELGDATTVAALTSHIDDRRDASSRPLVHLDFGEGIVIIKIAGDDELVGDPAQLPPSPRRVARRRVLRRIGGGGPVHDDSSFSVMVVL